MAIAVGTRGRLGLPGLGRLLLAAMALGLGTYAAMVSLAISVRQPATDFARRLIPGSARSLALRAEKLASGTVDKAKWNAAAGVAKLALLRDPLLPSAAATLGFEAGLRGDAEVARRAFKYSNMVSRRDLRTHLFAIEYAVSQDDVAGALRSYDLALRTSRGASEILFPILAAALSDETIRAALVPIMLTRPAWGAPFVNYVANTAPDHRSAAALFGVLSARGYSFPEGAEASLLGALASSKDYATVGSYLALKEGRASRQRSRHPNFAGNPATPSPFDWNAQNDVGMATSIQPDRQGEIFSFSAVVGAGGAALRQLQLLPPGRYEIVSRLSALSPANAVPSWTIQCVDGAEVARLPLRLTREEAPMSNGHFTIKPGCQAQWLTLIVTPNDSPGGITGALSFAQIRPIEKSGQ
jgi:hypothetical protein